MAILKDPSVSLWRSEHGGIVGQLLMSQDGARAGKSGKVRRTATQNASRVNNASLVNAWRNLSGAQQTAWNGFGAANPGTDKYGNSIVWSGWNWFVRFNARVLLAGNARQDAPPASANPSYTPNFTFSFHVGSESLLLSFAPVPAGAEYFIIRRALYRPVSQNSFPEPGVFYRHIVPPAISPIVVGYIPSPWPEQQRHWVRAQAGDAYGRVDAAFYDSEVTG